MGFQGDNHLMVLLSRLRPKAQNLSNNLEGDLTITKQVETISEQVKILRSTVLSAVEATTRTLESHGTKNQLPEMIKVVNEKQRKSTYPTFLFSITSGCVRTRRREYWNSNLGGNPKATDRIPSPCGIENGAERRASKCP